MKTKLSICVPSLCTACPRACKVDRSKSVGFCNEKTLRIAKIQEHFMWEEPCLADERGTLAIFFSGCNLGCEYCQNHQISRGGVGKTYTVEQFCQLVEEKQMSHSSIDLVTPTHFSQELKLAFSKIKKRVPVIWNTSGYETVENIEEVATFVDVFLTDLKYADNFLATRFSKCPEYFTHALPAIKKMCQLKSDVMQGNLLVQGVIIRHLVLPDCVKNSLRVLDVVATYFPERKISLMSQFTPNGKSQLNRKLTAIEYKTVINHMQKLGLSNGYSQDFESADGCFVPDFD